MLALRIELSNIRQYEHVEIFFPQKGLIGIRGDNGAGKSTLFNSIDWILYGKYKGVTQSELVSHDSKLKSKTYGILDFVHQDDFYRVRRDISTSPAKNFVQKNGHSVAAGTTNLNDYIKDLFKMDQESFRTCYYASQDDFDSLAKLNSAPRVQMISKLLRIETIDYAAEKTRKEKRVIEIEIEEAKRHLRNEDELRLTLSQTKSDLKEVITNISKVEKDLKKIETKRDELYKTKKESDETFEKYQSISSIISHDEIKKQTLTDHSLRSMNSQLTSLEQKEARLHTISNQKEHYFSLLQKKDELNEAKEQFLAAYRIEKQKKDASNSIQEIDTALVEVEKQLTSFTEVELQVIELEKNISSKESDLTTLRDNVSQIDTILSVNKNKYQEINKEINGFKQLGKDIPCPTCKRPLGEHQEEHLKLLEENKQEVINQTVLLKGKYDDMVSKSIQLKEQTETSKSSLRTLISQLAQKSGYVAKKENYLNDKKRNELLINELNMQRKELPDVIEFDANSYKMLVEEIKTLIPLYEEIIQLENTVKEIPVVKDNIEQVKQQLADLDIHIKTQINKRNLLSFDKEKHKTLSTQMEELQNIIDTLKDSKYTLQSRSEILQNTLRNIEENIKEDEQKRIQLTDKQAMVIKLTILDQLYKTYKLDKFTKLSPTLSDFMSDMMDLITDGRYDQVYLDKQFNIFIYRNGKPYPLDIFSGGEQKLAALCQRIAISQLLVSQTGQASFDMIALDEVFGSQDAKRQDAMIDMFRNLNEMFSQIFIISHSENVKDMFDHTLHIELDGKVSKAKWIKDEYNRPTWNEMEIREFVAKNFDGQEIEQEN